MVAPALIAELLYAARPELDREAVLERVRRELPRSRLHRRRALDGTAITVADAPTVLEGEHDFGPTWDWPEARDAVERATHCVSLAQLMGHLHPPQDRLTAFRSAFDAPAATTDPLGSWWPEGAAPAAIVSRRRSRARRARR